MTKKTYGELVFEHHAKGLTLEDDIIEYRRQMEPSVVEKVHKCAHDSRHHHIYKNKDFYVVLGFKVERIGQGVNPLVWARQSCPTPVYKQAVWKYHHKSGALEFLWSIPDQILYYYILNNYQKLMDDPETRDITKFCILMERGDLLEWVKKENGEKQDAVIVINKGAECLTN